MASTTQQDPPAPPPLSLSTDIEGPDEQDIDLDDDADDLCLPLSGSDADTRMEPIEFLGEYPSLAAYFCSQLEDHIAEPALWILTCLDMKAIQRRFEGSKYRYCQEGQAVYRVGMRADPKPTPGEDPPGPWMPARG